MRVAVCISGQMRTYKFAYESLMEHVVLPLQADVFVDTWSKSGNTNKLVLFLPPAFVNLLPKEYHHAEPSVIFNKQSIFQQTFPFLFAELEKLAISDKNITRDELGELYNPIFMNIEEFHTGLFPQFNLDRLGALFPDRTALNAIPMFYKIRSCDLLRQKYERESGFTYDAVIRTRADLAFQAELELGKDTYKGRLATLHNPFYDILNVTEVMSNDMFYIGDSQTSSYASSIYNKLPSYWEPDFDRAREFSDRGPERVLNDHLREQGLAGDVLHLNSPPHRVALGLPFERLLACLEIDLSTVGSLPAFIPAAIALAQSRYAVEKYVEGLESEALDILEKSISIGHIWCDAPYIGRAKIAHLRNDWEGLRHWARLAQQAGQSSIYQEIFADLDLAETSAIKFESNKNGEGVCTQARGGAATTEKKIAIVLRVAQLERCDKSERPRNDYDLSRFVSFQKAVHESIMKHIVSSNPGCHFDFFIHGWGAEQAEALMALYSPTAFSFEKEEWFADVIESKVDTPEAFSDVSSFLSLKKAVELVERSSVLYNQVILYRNDLLLWKDIKLDTYKSDFIYVNAHPGSDGDFHFVMNSANMSRFKWCFDWISRDNPYHVHSSIRRFVNEAMGLDLHMDQIVPGLHQELVWKLGSLPR
jgi:hypothetical protein